MDSSDLAYERLLKQRETFRRTVGIWLGALVGLVFGLVSQTINLAALPGLNLYQPPLGPLGNILLFTLLGALLGGVCGWHFGSVEGVLLASLLGALILMISLVYTGHRWEMLGQRIIAGLSLFLPATALLVPALALLRWVINEQEEYRHLPPLAFQRAWRPVFLTLLAAAVGVLWLLPDQGQRSLRQLDILLQSAQHSADLPQPLSPPDIEDYRANAQGTYTLEWERYNVNRYAIGYYPKAGWDPTAAVARFSNDWTLVCIYTNPDFPPSCKGFGGIQ